MSDNIPLEIQLEIIKKVSDFKSLLRFRSVSKPWKSFIDSSEFITGYGARETQPRRLLLRYIDPYYAVKYVCFVDEENDTLTQQQDFAPNVSDLVKQLNYSQLIGSSCGLWCLYGYKKRPTKMLVIWNPSIRKSVGIVVPCELKPTSGRLNHFGFGVCPSTYDPTIVGMSYMYLEKKDTDKWQVGIFTLSSKTWKMIPSTNVPRESIRLRPTTQVAIDRFIFWVANDRIAANDGVSRSTILILSFDLITHEFKEIHLPNSLANKFSPIMLISKLGESIVVSTYIDELNGRAYGVWMMGEEDGVMKSFTKLFTINTPDSSIRRLLGFRKNGEPIMATLKEDEQFAALEVYEPCSEHFNNLGIYGGSGSFFIRPYTETLLLIDHLDGCIISNNY